jgi:hypothetical protein
MQCSEGEGHCCWFGEVCGHLVVNVNGRRWACALMVKYHDWEAVYESEEWPMVLDTAMKAGLPPTYKCGEWPTKGERCGECGNIG